MDDGALIGGREPFKIRIVEYDEAWPRAFRDVETRVRSALGDGVGAVEHIGSTSVPGLAAKPIVDVLITVADVTDEATYVTPLEAQGYELRVREADHRMLRTPGRTVHLHVYEPAHPAVRDYLDFRDWLRISADDRALYATAKRRLATLDWADVNDYADAKTEVIAQIMGRARRWRLNGQ